MALDTSTKTPLPSQGSSFFSELETFLGEEDAARYKDIFTSFVVSNGLHGTGASLIGDPGATVAYPGGFYVSETGTITYADNTAHHWVIIYKDTTTVLGGDWIRVSGTHYFFDPVAASQPATPTDAIMLMDVVTSGGSITTVSDLRALDPFTMPADTGKVFVSSNDTTRNYLFNKIVSGTGTTVTEVNDGGDETLQIDTDGKTRISTNDTTRDFLDTKIIDGDGITTTITSGFGDERLDFDVDLSTTSGLEFNTGQLQVNTVTNGGISLNANGVVLDITGTAETTSNLDTPDDEIIIEDASQTGEKKRKIKLSLLQPTGMIIPWIGTFAAAPPDAWIHANGNTIGNASSSATERDNEDCKELFILLWDSFADSQAPVSSGRGASGIADFNAAKTITLPNMQGFFPGGTGGTTMATHGISGGEEAVTLALGEMPEHSHVQQANASGGSVGPSLVGAVASTAAGNTDVAGNNESHENMPPFVAFSFIIKL